MANDRFYVTDLGTKKIAIAANQGKKVNITTLAIGDGQVGAERDYTIEALVNQVYSKEMDDSDRYEIDPKNPNTLILEVEVPDNAGVFEITEAGFLDDEGSLIIYGPVEGLRKRQGQNGTLYTIGLTCYVLFTNDDLENINLVIGTDGLRQLEFQVEDLQTFTGQLKEKLDETAESLKNYVLKEEGKGLSSNDFTQTYIDLINKHTKDIKSINEDVNTRALQSDYKTLNQKVTDLTSTVATKASQSSLDSLSSTVSSLSSTVDKKASQSSLNSLSSTVSNLSTTVNNFKSSTTTDLTSLKSRVTTIENTLSGLATVLERLI